MNKSQRQELKRALSMDVLKLAFAEVESVANERLRNLAFGMKLDSQENILKAQVEQQNAKGMLMALDIMNELTQETEEQSEQGS